MLQKLNSHFSHRHNGDGSHESIYTKCDHQLNVFVVDDEPVIADSLGMILRGSGYMATSFTNPLDALNWTQTIAPNLLITDVAMPEMNGIELAMKVTESCPDCKVLLFSGQAETFDLLSAAKVKGYHFDILTKPVHPRDLLNRLTSLRITPPELKTVDNWKPTKQRAELSPHPCV